MRGSTRIKKDPSMSGGNPPEGVAAGILSPAAPPTPCPTLLPMPRPLRHLDHEAGRLRPHGI
jgi:hypothetical protein